MKGQVWIWDRCGYACLEMDFNDQVLEKIGITQLWDGPHKEEVKGKRECLRDLVGKKLA